MAEVIWTNPAISQLQDIIVYIARNSQLNAVRFGERLLSAPEQLNQFPLIGARVPEFDRQDLRELLVFPYRIIYQVRGEECLILAVIHGHRDLAKIFRQDQISPDE